MILLALSRVAADGGADVGGCVADGGAVEGGLDGVGGGAAPGACCACIATVAVSSTAAQIPDQIAFLIIPPEAATSCNPQTAWDRAFRVDSSRVRDLARASRFHMGEGLGRLMLQAFNGKEGFDLMLESPLYSVCAMCVTGSRCREVIRAILRLVVMRRGGDGNGTGETTDEANRDV